MTLIVLAFVVWGAAWFLNVRLAHGPMAGSQVVRTGVPLIFGATILIAWELLVRGLEIDLVILPPPSLVIQTFLANLPTLWSDFVQTILKGALSGYVFGILAALGVAILVDRYDYLRRGLLPVGNFMAALPIVGTAPILVMWFGFDWQSKAAVVVVMVFFPMLVNTVAGLADTSSMQRDLMRTYSASYWQTLFALRFPAALPFIFNGLKISATLALIGAIVAEFFGSPTVGLGFRINASLGQLSLDMVWSVIIVAAISGSLLYGLLTLLERRLTFWHPSQRK
ncbi:MAG: ABC transporter permease subunit [Boseongicola sp.]|nr:MAG: ABC transporter permease subunit [Boseongicola sp.]